MAQELTVDGKQYISSKRAAEVSGYAQDYIGQLSRKQLIDARRIGGLWYVQMDSLNAYKQEAEEYKPQPPAPMDRGNELETSVSFDGKEYVSASRAAEVTGYHQDYIGQLARNGTILSRQIGNRWYVDREALLAHKQEKDALLAAVQAQAVGLQRNSAAASQEAQKQAAGTTVTGAMNYFTERAEVLPNIAKNEQSDQITESEEVQSKEDIDPEPTQIAIRRIRTKRGDEVLTAQYLPENNDGEARKPRTQRRIPVLAMAGGALATIVIVLTVGYSATNGSSVYTLSNRMSNAAAAIGSGPAIQRVVDFIEMFLPQLTYRRQ